MEISIMLMHDLENQIFRYDDGKKKEETLKKATK